MDPSDDNCKCDQPMKCRNDEDNQKREDKRSKKVIKGCEIHYINKCDSVNKGSKTKDGGSTCSVSHLGKNPTSKQELRSSSPSIVLAEDGGSINIKIKLSEEENEFEKMGKMCNVQNKSVIHDDEKKFQFEKESVPGLRIEIRIGTEVMNSQLADDANMSEIENKSVVNMTCSKKNNAFKDINNCTVESKLEKNKTSRLENNPEDWDVNNSIPVRKCTSEVENKPKGHKVENKSNSETPFPKIGCQSEDKDNSNVCNAVDKTISNKPSFRKETSLEAVDKSNVKNKTDQVVPCGSINKNQSEVRNDIHVCSIENECVKDIPCSLKDNKSKVEHKIKTCNIDNKPIPDTPCSKEENLSEVEDNPKVCNSEKKLIPDQLCSGKKTTPHVEDKPEVHEIEEKPALDELCSETKIICKLDNTHEVSNKNKVSVNDLSCSIDGDMSDIKKTSVNCIENKIPVIKCKKKEKEEKHCEHKCKKSTCDNISDPDIERTSSNTKCPSKHNQPQCGQDPCSKTDSCVDCALEKIKCAVVATVKSCSPNPKKDCSFFSKEKTEAHCKTIRTLSRFANDCCCKVVEITQDPCRARESIRELTCGVKNTTLEVVHTTSNVIELIVCKVKGFFGIQTEPEPEPEEPSRFSRFFSSKKVEMRRDNPMVNTSESIHSFIFKNSENSSYDQLKVPITIKDFPPLDDDESSPYDIPVPIERYDEPVVGEPNIYSGIRSAVLGLFYKKQSNSSSNTSVNSKNSFEDCLRRIDD